MASTKLKGKTSRAKSRVDREQLSRKNQAFMPVMKKVTAEELAAEFEPAKKAEPKAEEKVEESVSADKE